MPGVDFDSVRAAISIGQVLDVIGFVPLSRTGYQLRGACPLHQASQPASRTFSVNLATNRSRCFKCGAAGGQLELWAKVRNVTVYEAAVELCGKIGIDVPWVRNW